MQTKTSNILGSLLIGSVLLLSACCEGPKPKVAIQAKPVTLKLFEKIETAIFRAEYHFKPEGQRRQTNYLYVSVQDLKSSVAKAKYQAFHQGKSVGYQRALIPRQQARVFLLALENAQLRKCTRSEYKASPDYVDRIISLHHSGHAHTFGGQFNNETPKLFLEGQLKKYGPICGDMVAVEKAFRSLVPFSNSHFKVHGQLETFTEQPYK